MIVFIPSLSFGQEDTDLLTMDAYIVVADSSNNYFDLREKMFDLSDKLSIKIDTMGRGYNKTKDLICFPDNHEDEIYAGDYFPRRYPSVNLSLEYLDYYLKGKKPTGGTILLITSISDNKKKADKELKKVRKYEPHAYIFNAKIYMGCMH